MGFIIETNRLNIAVAVRVAATETVAVETAVTRISVEGTGISKSVPGTSNIRTSGGSCGTGGLGGSERGLEASVSPSSTLLGGFTPGGGLRSLGGTTRGLYEGTVPLGSSIVGVGSFIGSATGNLISGMTIGSPKKSTFNKCDSFIIYSVIRRSSQFFQQINNKSLDLFGLYKPKKKRANKK